MSINNDREVSRRAFLAAAGGTLVNIGLPGSFIKLANAEQSALKSSVRPDGRPRLPPGQSAVKRLITMGGTAPGNADTTGWRLRVHGEVDNSFVLSYRELLALEQVDIVCDVHCVTGWSLLDSHWRGVRLETIMDKARPGRNGRYVIFEAAAGFTSNIPISDMRKDDAILAHSLYGEKLPGENGAPVRALVPDRYFYKSAKWLEAIKVTSRDAPGFWESAGYSNSADPWKNERFD